MKRLLNRLNRLEIENNLSFSKQELLKNSFLGLDGVHRKLLIIEGLRNDHYQEAVINLVDVKSCSLKKVYGFIKAGDLRKRKLDQLLDKICLHFEFGNNKEPIEVSFYENIDSQLSDLSELEQKAKYWGKLLSNMLAPKLKTIA